MGHTDLITHHLGAGLPASLERQPTNKARGILHYSIVDLVCITVYRIL